VVWSATADVEKFDEAVDWFRARLPMTPALAAKMTGHASARAWTIAGVAQLDVVLQTYESLLKAIEKGTPLKEWQDEIEEKLTAAWGRKDSGRLETIFRNATQQAYNAGRWRQMNADDVKALRPFVEFDGIGDERQTKDICRPIDGTIVSIDDPWIESHHPQLHHRCRSKLNSLSRKEAERRGVTKDPPDAKADDGFGKIPDDNAEPWRPKPKDYPKEVFKVHEQKNTPTEGVHFKKLTSNAPKKAQAKALKALEEKQLLPYLERAPLEELILNTSAGKRGVNGWYEPGRQRLAAGLTRKAGSFNGLFEPGRSWSMSASSATADEAIQRTLVHEVAHHVHGKGKSDVDDAIRNAFKSPARKAITRYAAYNHSEYFAESFTAYKYQRAELREHDPVGFAMVEEVLRLRGISS
jgi:SPP1 gp7 family putative phage head morphogenesis protein